jgi:L-lactate dehydrogenase complex protein LldF
VGIDIPTLLVRLRGDLADAGRVRPGDRLLRRIYRWGMASPQRFRRLHRWLVRSGPLRSWSLGRELPAPAAQTFRERWLGRQRP